MTGFQENYAQRNIDNKSFGLLARIDWNINQNHKLALRYQHNNSYDDNYGVGSTSYMFENSGYRMNNKTNSIVAELTSHLGQNLYNEFRASASFIRDHRDVALPGTNCANQQYSCTGRNKHHCQHRYGIFFWS